jgi:hypothetical protein
MSQSPSSIVTVEERLLKPWKYIGYHAFSSFISSDNDFFFLRQFGTLHARVLLALQDEIVALESKLQDLDRWASRKEERDLHNGSFRQDCVKERVGLLGMLEVKLFRYGECGHRGLLNNRLCPAGPSQP